MNLWAIEKYMRTNGLSRAQFARLIGVSPSTVTDWMKGRRSVCGRLGCQIERATRGELRYSELYSSRCCPVELALLEILAQIEVHLKRSDLMENNPYRVLDIQCIQDLKTQTIAYLENGGAKERTPKKTKAP